MESTLWVSITGAALTFIGVIVTAVLTQRGARAQRHIDSRTKLVDQLEQRVEALIKDNAALDEKLTELRRRQEDIENERASDRAAMDLLSSYCRRLLILLDEHSIVAPPPPEGLPGLGWRRSTPVDPAANSGGPA